MRYNGYMKIYTAHSREFDYENELYQPIRSAEQLPQSDIILPHENDKASANGRDFYKQLDLVIAEVSYPATGLGIELGWAFDSGVPIVCIYQSGKHYSGSLYAVTKQFYEYHNSDELISIIKTLCQNIAEQN